MAPRPLLAERGSRDGVEPDQWVAYERTEPRRHDTALGLADRATIEFLEGSHTIHRLGTLDFLECHLGRPQAAPWARLIPRTCSTGTL